MRCNTCPLVLTCWNGMLDAEAQATLCSRCLRLVVPAPDADHKPQYYTLQCEQRDLNQIRGQLKNPFPLYGQDILDPGPGMTHQLHIGVCVICSETINHIGGSYVDLDEEAAASADGNALGLQFRPRRR